MLGEYLLMFPTSPFVSIISILSHTAYTKTATKCATAMRDAKKLIGRNIKLIARHGAMKTSDAKGGIGKVFVLSLFGYEYA